MAGGVPLNRSSCQRATTFSYACLESLVRLDAARSS
jgi:hypothetical protein